MAQKRIGIIMNGVTGRMGMNQHLIRSVLSIRDAGGLRLGSGDHVVPDPILVGRNADKLRDLAKAHGIARWTTDIDGTLENKDDTVFFDAGLTQLRAETLSKAIEAGKDIYCEKPIAMNLQEAMGLVLQAERAKVRTGVVHDKLSLPGVRKLRRLVDEGFFGALLSVRIEFGYWVFVGDQQPSQRPSWNYRQDDGGGIILDMLCHWRYLLDNLFGAVESVSCLAANHIPTRYDERGKPYRADAEDAAYCTFVLEGGIIAQVNSSWCTRVRRDDLVTFHVDGSAGSAVAGLTECHTQSLVDTPTPKWNPDLPQEIDFHATWKKVTDEEVYENAFKVQWEMFIRHLLEGTPWSYTLREGAKGVQLAEMARQSWKERCWVNVPALREE